MSTRLWALALSFIFLLFLAVSSLAATWGPATTYDELRKYLSAASHGDVILVSGSFSAEGKHPLSTVGNIHISSAEDASASIRGLRLRDASVTLTNISLVDSLMIDGTSHVQLASGVSVSGANGRSGVDFSGSGSLIIDHGCSITGGSESAGVSIAHHGGEFFASIEGSVQGGSGATGGTGVVISPLLTSGAAMISGSVQGGEGTGHGGHALNLYELSGNAFVTVDGNLHGGSGAIGGDGIQLVSARDSVNVGIGGRISGGHGETHGGDALILMNAEDAAAFHLSGFFSGGNVSETNAQPGTSLQLVGDSTAARTYVTDCILEDGTHLAPIKQPTPTPAAPDVTPLPGITSSVEAVDALATPDPEPQDAPSSVPTEIPPADPLPDPTSTSEPEATANPSESLEATPDEAL